jgi:ABC-2 type transport system ATP-binding protein
MYAVEMKDYTKVLKGATVLSHVTLTLESGGIYGFYGHNGSGKTMLFRAISGLIHPTSGEVSVFGKKIGTDVSFPESLGIVIESVGFWPYNNGYQNLETLASIRGKIGPEEIRNALIRVGLDPADKRPYSKYSLGMKQRLGIAQAVMEKPQLILLDEPTNAIDEDGVEKIHTVIQEEQKRGATILIASHISSDLRLLCSRFFKMNDGELKETKGEDIK